MYRADNDPSGTGKCHQIWEIWSRKTIFFSDSAFFEKDSKTFAIAIVSDLNAVFDPLNTVKQMIEFAFKFSENFYATLCDQERKPISKQMISHME